MGIWIMAAVLAVVLVVGFPIYASILSVPVLLVRNALAALKSVPQMGLDLEDAAD